MTFLHGDMRFYNNIFVQQPMHPVLKAAMEAMNQRYGAINYDNGVEFWFELEAE